jgi:hypothetical protein
MPLQRLKFTPGVNRDQTNYAGEGGFYECDKIRFRSGFPQKIGGWLRYGLFTLAGICRQMYNYITTNSDNLMGLGTNEKLYIETGGGTLIDITPLRATFVSPATNNCIDVTNGSNSVNVNIVNHGAEAGDWVTFSGITGSGVPATIGGIPVSQMNKEVQVATVVDSDNFTFLTTSSATSTVSNAGGTAITAAFQINVGFAYIAYGYGWGAGTWGRSGWGEGSLTPVVDQQRDWFMDNFDNDLIANIRLGPIYIWEYDGTFTSRAVLLSSLTGASDVPTEAMQILVSQNDKHLLAFGCTPYGGGSFDPLLIRWANQDDPTNWTPAATNSAGFARISRGSRIIRALPTRQEILVFTDSHLYSQQFTGTTDVFSLQELADNISIMSPRACISANNVTYWMGTDKFYAYSGRVETLPCTLRNHVFNNFNYNQAPQVICGTNEGYHEIWWFYPSQNASTNDSYVIYNYMERVWYYGSIARTAWLDTPLRQYPQAVGGYYVYNHEQGTNDDTNPMTSYIQTNDFDLVDGDQFVLIKRIIPDLNFEGSTAASPIVYMTVKPRNFPGSNYNSSNNPSVTRTATVPVEQYTDQVFIRARARQIGFKIQSEDLNVQWQLGTPRLDGRPDGKR